MGGIGPSDAADPSQLFALRWTDFHQCILTTFRVLRDEEDFVDVTVSCENVQYGAHKVLLSACSPFFRSLLKANPCPHPIIILNNVRRIDFEALLKFMYNGEVHISQEQLTEFLKTAAALQVRGLADVSSKDQDKLSNMSASVPWTTNDDDASMYVNANSRSSCGKRSSLNVENSSSSKKPRPNENQNLRYSVSPPTNRASVASDNADGKPSSLSDSVHSLPQGDERSQSAQNSQPAHSSNGDESSDYDDEASDADGDPEAPDDNVGVHDLAPPRLEVPDFAMSDRAKGDGLNPGLFDPQRHRGAYPNPLGINFHDIAGIFPNLNMHSSSQDNYGGGTGSSSSSSSSACYGGLVEPKPICKECGRVYSSISNLKQHIANVHSTTPQWEPCPMCGKHFKTRQYLFNHLLQTHGIRQRGNRMPIMPSSFGGVGGPLSLPPPPVSSSAPGPSHVAAHGQQVGPHPSPLSQLSQSPSVSLTRVCPSSAVFPPPPPPLPPPPPAPSSLVSSMAPPPPPPPQQQQQQQQQPMPSGTPSSVVGPPPSHSPMDSNIQVDRRTMPHQATPSAALGQKDRELNNAVEQCLHYLSK